MLKKTIITISIFFLIIVLHPKVVFGQTAIAYPSEDQMVLFSPNTLHTNIVTFKNPRGEIIASGALDISNAGKGQIGVFIQTLVHKDVDKIRMKVFIDVFDEKIEDWSGVANFDYTYLSEDYQDGHLSGASESFNVKGLPADRYYRLRGIHAVWKDDIYEHFNTDTYGLLITSRP